MITYSTEFQISPQNSVENVLTTCREWILASPHSLIPKTEQLNIPEYGENCFDFADEHVTICMAKCEQYCIGGLKYIKVENDNIQWTTTVVTRKNNSEQLVSVQIDCEALSITSALPNPHKPLIIKKIIQELRGGMDGQIPVTDKPFLLSPGEEDIAAALINGNAGNRLPIIYVSHSTREEFANPTLLAELSSGLAHVIVEPTREFSFILRSKVNYRNVYNGTIGVYWPESNMRSKYFIGNKTCNKRIIQDNILNELRLALVNRRQASDCNWLHLQEISSKNKLDELASREETQLNDWHKVYSEEIAAKEAIISNQELQITRLTNQLRKANTEIQESGIAISCGTEQEFYEGEFKDILIKSLHAAQHNCLQDSRRWHILATFLSQNKISGYTNGITEEIKQLLKTCTSLDRRTKSALLKLGFSISDEGKHYKLTFQNDPRYIFVLSKTGSDHRGGRNTCSEIIQKLFS